MNRLLVTMALLFALLFTSTAGADPLQPASSTGSEIAADDQSALRSIAPQSAEDGTSIASKLEEALQQQIEEKELSYSGLLTLFAQQAKLIEKVRFDSESRLSVFFTDDSSLATYYPDRAEMSSILADNGITTWVNSAGEEASFADQFWFIVRLLLFASLVLGVIYIISRRSRRGRESILGKESKADGIATKDIPSVFFKDVVGCNEVVLEVKECADFLKKPQIFTSMGAELPSGVLLHGPPGTGKTMMAKALAAEANASFFAATGSAFCDKYVGQGAANVRSLFGQAKKVSGNAVIFIDEIDAVASKRRGSGEQGNDERDATLNQLLDEMDGFKGNPDCSILVVAATNLKDKLDPAILRPGRLSRHIEVPLPSMQGRLDLFAVYSIGKPLAEDVDLMKLALISNGSSGADISNIMNESAFVAIRNEHDVITMADIEDAHLKILAGPERANSPVSEGEIEAIAYHEAGHTLCSELCPSHEEVQKVTIKARNGGAAGLALYGSRDKALHYADDLHERLVVLLAGRAAEQVHFGRVSSGAQNDLQQASDIARMAVEQFGFSPQAGQIQHNREIHMSEKSREVSDAEVERLVDHAYQQAAAMLTEHHDLLTTLAQELLEKKSMDRDQILACLGQTPVVVATHNMRLKAAPQAALEPVAATVEPSSKRIRTRAELALRALSVRRLRSRKRTRVDAFSNKNDSASKSQ